MEAIIENAENDKHGAIITNVHGGTPPYEYEWDFGSTDASVFNLSSNWYQVTVSDSHNCIATGNFFVDNIIVESVIENHSKACIYPIPAVDFIMVNGIRDVDFAFIFDISGRLIKSFDQSNGGIVLNISEIPSGIYILRVTSNRENHSFQITIID